MANSPSSDSGQKINMKRLYLIVFLRFSMFLLIFGLLFFIPAGTLQFWEAWVFFGVIIIPMLFALRWLAKNSPELLERRMRGKEKEKEQKRLIGLSMLYFLGTYSLPGFDFRYGWSDVPLWVIILADIIIVLGYLIFFRVLKENAYASRIIEVEKEQEVISTGPYALVRHPMYVGVLIMYTFCPLALGSYWAVIPTVLLFIMIVFRIKNEEKVLSRDLKGYTEYMQKVKYRLVPGVW